MLIRVGNTATDNMIFIDPVNNFTIPQEWIDKAPIPLDELEKGVSDGLFVVLSNGDILNRGYTTGTTCAAAAKSAILSLKKKDMVRTVLVPTPCGIRAKLDVRALAGRSEVVKIPGDHASDVTGGLVFVAEAKPATAISLIAADGIGTVTKGGLQVKAGEPAINPVPKLQIMDAVKEGLSETGLEGAAVTLSVPDGGKVSERTLNSAIGVIGGISVLGTTGFVEPWSDHLGEVKMDLISDASRVVLTTGRIGMRYSQMLFPEHTVVMVGSMIDEGIHASRGETIICGLPGLILKWAVPDILIETGFNTVQELIEKERNSQAIDNAVAAAVEKSEGARIVLVDRSGTVIRDSGGVL